MVVCCCNCGCPAPSAAMDMVDTMCLDLTSGGFLREGAGLIATPLFSDLGEMGG